MMESGDPDLTDKIVNHYKAYHDALMGDWYLPISYSVENGLVCGRLEFELGAEIDKFPDNDEAEIKTLIATGIRHAILCFIIASVGADSSAKPN